MYFYVGWLVQERIAPSCFSWDSSPMITDILFISCNPFRFRNTNYWNVMAGATLQMWQCLSFLFSFIHLFKFPICISDNSFSHGSLNFLWADCFSNSQQFATLQIIRIGETFKYGALKVSAAFNSEYFPCFSVDISKMKSPGRHLY